MSRRRTEHEPNRESLLRIAERGELLDDPLVQNLLRSAAILENPHLTRQIERLLTTKAVHQQIQPFTAKPPRLALRGERLRLGTSKAQPFEVVQADLTRHLLAVGQSGTGKTTLFYNLMDQLTVPFWTFDLKQDYRHLIQHDADLLVLPWPELRFNPLKPPAGVQPRRWAQVFSEILGHATALLSGSKNYLMAQLIELYRYYDLFDEVAPPYPSLHELQLLMERDKINYVRKQANYRDTVVNRLAAMTLTAGTVFDCSQGHSLEDLLERNVVFEFDGLSRDLQNFLMEILFAYVYEYRLAQNHRGGDLRHVFFLDEGKQVFSVYKERQDAAGLPAIDELTAKMREFGEGLVVADQEATKLTDSLKANTYTKVLLATGDARQFHEVAESMRLSNRQRDVAARLAIGEAIVQVGNCDPCPVRLAHVDVAKTISEAELRKQQTAIWNELAATPRELTPAFTKQVGLHDAAADPTPVPDDPPRAIDLSADAERLLTDVVERPFTSLTGRYEQFASAYQGNKTKNELVDSGLVREHKVHAGPEKRKLLELTDRGRTYAETQLNLDPQRRGRGGIVHQFWQHRLKQLFEDAGWPAKREVFDADVYVNLGETELAVEVAMEDTQRECEHVEKHLSRFDAVWVVCRNETVRDGLRQRLAEHGLLLDHVTLRLVRKLQDTGNGPMA